MADDRLTQLWELQAGQQDELGLNPKHMSAVDRARATSDLVLQLHEEVSELGRLSSSYKRHLLKGDFIDPDNVADEVADILKVAIALAQLHGLDHNEVFQAFCHKTDVVRAKAEGERIKLERDTKIICIDLDDVIGDLSVWTKKLAKLKGGAPANDRTWALLESFKDEFYKGGGFRNLPVIEGAQRGINDLVDLGYTIVIVTARPQWQYKRLYADTLWWLDKHSIPRDLILFNKDKVEAIYSHLSPAWPVAFVEDHPSNAIGLADAGIQVLLFDQPHNRDVAINERIHRVHGWAGVLEHLRP